jgi:hypothetical protein
LLALVTLNCFADPAAAVAPELEFIPALAPAEVDPFAEALAPLWSGELAAPEVASALLLPLPVPLTWTSFPISVRTLSRLPVNL